MPSRRSPLPKARFAANPQVSRRDGGHALNLHKFASDGVVLLGHLQGGRDNKIWLAPDFKESLAKTDKSEVEFIKLFVKLPAFDSDGYPFQYRGVTDYPGLYFVGLPWLYKQKSGHLFGVGEDAEYIASEIDRR